MGSKTEWWVEDQTGGEQHLADELPSEPTSYAAWTLHYGGSVGLFEACARPLKLL